MKFNFSAMTACFFVIATSLTVEAGTYSPVLGDLLSGTTTSSADGGHNPLPFVPQYVKLASSGTLTQTGGNVMNVGDSFEIVQAFSFDGSSGYLANAAGTQIGDLGTGGYGAIVWSAEVSSVVFANTVVGDGVVSQIADGAGNVVTELGSLSWGAGVTGAFGAVLTSETFDFAGADWSTIDGNAGSIDVAGAFNLSSTGDSDEIASTNIGGKYSLSNAFVGDMILASVPPEIDWFQVSDANGNIPATNLVGFGGEIVLEDSGNAGTLEILSYSVGGGGSFSGGGLALMNPVPEPSSLLAIGGCLGFAGLVRRRRMARKTAEK